VKRAVDHEQDNGASHNDIAAALNGWVSRPNVLAYLAARALSQRAAKSLRAAGLETSVSTWHRELDRRDPGRAMLDLRVDPAEIDDLDGLHRRVADALAAAGIVIELPDAATLVDQLEHGPPTLREMTRDEALLSLVDYESVASLRLGQRPFGLE
jgi:hypothetical protein